MTTNSVQICLGKQPALVDEPVGIRVSRLEPNAHVTITASIDFGGSRFVSDARFRADSHGCVDTARFASHAGTYMGVDPFGLWWSGSRVGPAPSTPGLAPVVANVQVSTRSSMTEVDLERAWLAPGATLAPVAEPGVQGVFARPAGDGPFPAIVAFAGSGGGLGGSAGWAALFASRGFATLAISYFGAPGLPPDLVNVEVEVVERAIEWLYRRRDIKRGVGVMGYSRGSELAMLAGVLFDQVDAVVACAPSGVVWNGLDQYGPVYSPAWTFRGEPVPYALVNKPTRQIDLDEPFSLVPLFDEALEDKAMIRAAEIPVERMRGPVLLLSGGADLMWPSTRMAQIAEQRAERYNRARCVEHLSYADAGHVGFLPPGTPVITSVRRHPLTGGFYAFGGTRAANARARADSWPRVLQFLTRTLS
jgi:dienelactone hydrolase